jgi:hypothetical protein
MNFNFFVIVFGLVVVTLNQAWATKARGTALGNSFHLQGTQTLYSSPLHAISLDNFFALETGLTTATSSSNNASGAVLFAVSDSSKLLFSVGHLDESVQTQRTFLNNLGGVVGYKPQQNPVEIIFAHKGDGQNFGLGLYASKYRNTISGEAEASSGLRVTSSWGDFSWRANLGLVSSATNASGDQSEGGGYTNLALRYRAGVLRYGADFTQWQVKQMLNGASEPNQSHQNRTMTLRMAHITKMEGGEVFATAALEQNEIKDRLADRTFRRQTLPLILGLENKAADWLVLRGSVLQTVLLAQSKDEVGYPAAAVSGATGVVDAEYAAEPNNTRVSVGASLVFGKVQIDGLLSGLTGSTANQKVDGTNLLSQVGVVYKY